MNEIEYDVFLVYYFNYVNKEIQRDIPVPRFFPKSSLVKSQNFFTDEWEFSDSLPHLHSFSTLIVKKVPDFLDPFV